MDAPLDTSNNTRTKYEQNRDAVIGLLKAKLPKDTDGLKNALRDIEWRYIGIVSARVEAQVELQARRLQYLHPKDKELTDMDRKIHLDANTSDAQATYEQLAGIEKALEQRIVVIQTLLAT